jgi:hypothetical protein
VRGTRRYLLRCREPLGSAGKVRYLRIERPWLFVWHKICAEYDGPAGESPQQNRPHAVLLDVGVAAPSPREGAPFSLH